jgi:hypothetical protein
VAYFPDLATVKSHSVMPSDDIDALNAAEPGWILARALSLEGDINGRLRKRYAVPFSTPVPEAALNWLGALLDPEMYLKRGINPSDEQQARIEKRAETADKKITEAADAEKGLFDLPLRQDTTDTGIEQPTTLAYSEQSPFTGKHKQLDAVQYNRRYG